MPRFSQVALVLVTLGLCIGINSWRYPIVRQMVAQLPTWEFALQPKQNEAASSLSAPPHPAPLMTEHNHFFGTDPSGAAMPLSVRRETVPSHHPQARQASGEQPLGEPLSSRRNTPPLPPTTLPPQGLQDSEAKSSATSPPDGESPFKLEAEKSPSPDTTPIKQDNFIPQENESPSGATPVGSASIAPTDPPSKTQGTKNTLAPLPLVSLDTSEKPSEIAEQARSSPLAPSIEVCSDSICKVGPPDGTPCSPGKPSPGRARIIQIRAYPPDRDSSNRVSEAAPAPDRLSRATIQDGKPHQNMASSPSFEEKIELLPPVDPPGGKDSPPSELPWPPGTIPFYPSTQPN